MRHYGKCGKNIHWQLDAETLVISGEGEIDLLYGIKTNDVSLTHASWGYLREKVKRIMIKDGITGIDDVAFMNFTALETVWLPTSLETIGDYSFNGCKKLRAVRWLTPEEYPEAMPRLFLIGNMAFAECKRLTNFLLPSDIERIGHNAFEEVTKFKIFKSI